MLTKHTNASRNCLTDSLTSVSRVQSSLDSQTTLTPSRINIEDSRSSHQSFEVSVALAQTAKTTLAHGQTTQMVAREFILRLNSRTNEVSELTFGFIAYIMYHIYIIFAYDRPKPKFYLDAMTSCALTYYNPSRPV